MCSLSRSIDIENQQKQKKKEEIAKYLSHTPPDSLLSAMADMQSQGRSPQQTVQNVYECMKSSIENKISIYGIEHISVTRPRWTDNMRHGHTEYVTDHNSSINIGIEKKNSIYLYGLHGNTISISSNIAHLMLIDCTNICLSYVQAPVSGISIMRCTNLYITEMLDNEDMMDIDDSNSNGTSLGYLDCEYSSNVNIVAKLESSFTLYCVGSLGVCINKEQLGCNVYDQILGRADDTDISFMLGQSGSGMVYNS